MKIYPYLSYRREINETDVYYTCKLQKVWDSSYLLDCLFRHAFFIVLFLNISLATRDFATFSQHHCIKDMLPMKIYPYLSYRREIIKQNLRKANSPRRTSESESNWRDFQRREENFQRQIREMQQREQDLQRKLRVVKERYQDSQSQLTDIEHEQNMQRLLREL